MTDNPVHAASPGASPVASSQEVASDPELQGPGVLKEIEIKEG